MTYRILGRTGVKVSPICLGTMNFGKRTDAAEAGKILDAYFEAGGNFIDTANVYNAGASESIIGDWLAKTGRRDQVVLSTKVHGRRSDHVNDAGNHRWHIVREVEQLAAAGVLEVGEDGLPLPPPRDQAARHADRLAIGLRHGIPEGEDPGGGVAHRTVWA